MVETILIVLIVLAFAFDYTNGFHDSANAIATVVSTRALSPRMALAMAAFLNIVGAFFTTRVAATVGQGIVPPGAVNEKVILAALLGAISWNLATWYFGLPSSSSHALIGGIAGAGLFSVGYKVVNWGTICFKVLTPAVWSAMLGFGLSFAFMVILNHAFF